MNLLGQVGSRVLKKTVFFDNENIYGNKDIACTLIAYKKSGYTGRRKGTIKQRAERPDSLNDFNDNNVLDKTFYTWAVWFYLPGPDARHRPGSTVLEPDQLWGMYKILKIAYRKMKKLTESSLVDEYSEQIENNELTFFPEFFVQSFLGEVSLAFWLNSDGKYKYAKSFDLEETAKLIDTIYSLFSEGPELAKQLRGIK